VLNEHLFHALHRLHQDRDDTRPVTLDEYAVLGNAARRYLTPHRDVPSAADTHQAAAHVDYR
jgi:hypothetical protein